jgi:uncharacterized FlaG/YvyC family protein
MIEAVNSVISNAVLARGSAEQQSVVRSFAANPERVQEVAQAPYVSPYISMNIDHNKAVLQIRDSDTGDVIRQFPTESQMEAYRKAQAAQAARDSQIEAASAAQGRSAPIAADTGASRPAAPTPSEIATAAPAQQQSTGAPSSPAPQQPITIEA